MQQNCSHDDEQCIAAPKFHEPASRLKKEARNGHFRFWWTECLSEDGRLSILIRVPHLIMLQRVAPNQRKENQ